MWGAEPEADVVEDAFEPRQTRPWPRVSVKGFCVQLFISRVQPYEGEPSLEGEVSELVWEHFGLSQTDA